MSTLSFANAQGPNRVSETTAHRQWTLQDSCQLHLSMMQHNGPNIYVQFSQLFGKAHSTSCAHCLLWSGGDTSWATGPVLEIQHSRRSRSRRLSSCQARGGTATDPGHFQVVATTAGGRGILGLRCDPIAVYSRSSRLQFIDIRFRLATARRRCDPRNGSW